MLRGDSYDEDRVFSIDSHQQFRYGSAYVSTTTDIGIALAIADNRDYIYRIRCPPNLLDLNLALGSASRYPFEQEWVALGGIPFDFIMSLMQMQDNAGQSISALNGASSTEEFLQTYERESNTRFHPSPHYNESRLRFPDVDSLNAAERTYPWALAGFIGDNAENASQFPWSRFRLQSLGGLAIEFMDQLGEGVGWRRGQDFPLWHLNAQSQGNEADGVCADRNNDCSTASENVWSQPPEAQGTSGATDGSPRNEAGELHFGFEGQLRGPAVADLWLQANCETYFQPMRKRKITIETQGIVDTSPAVSPGGLKLIVSYSRSASFSQRKRKGVPSNIPFFGQDEGSG